MSEGLKVNELPVEAIANISSFLLGEPWQIKMKHNNLLKAIQTKYKYKITHRDFYENLREYPDEINGNRTKSKISYDMRSEMLNISMIQREVYRIEHYMKHMEQYHLNKNNLIYFIKIKVNYRRKFFNQYIDCKSNGLRLHQKRQGILSELNILTQNVDWELKRFGNIAKIEYITITIKARSCEY